jgi:hypothetical protein
MRATKRNQRKSGYQDYEFVLHVLRWLFANNLPIVRVVETRPAAQPEPESTLVVTQVVIEILNLPIGHRLYRGFPVRPAALKRFLESVGFRQQFVKWYGAQIASSLRLKSMAAGLQKGFLHLSGGRKGSLPPRAFLKAEYDKLVVEIKELQSRAELPLNPKRRALLVRFGLQTHARWVKLIKANVISLEQLANGSPQAAAKVLLSEQYSCSEESVHSRLFRKG